MAFEQYMALIQQNKYIYSLSLLAFFYILSQLAVILSRKVILRLTRKTTTEIDDLIVGRTSKPISFILLLIGFRLALFPLGIRLNILGFIENFGFVLIDNHTNLPRSIFYL